MGFGRVCSNQSIHQTHSKTTAALSLPPWSVIEAQTRKVWLPEGPGEWNQTSRQTVWGWGEASGAQADEGDDHGSGCGQFWGEKGINITRMKTYTELLAWWGRVLPCLSPPLSSSPQVQNWSQTSSKLITEHGKIWTCIWRIRTPEWSGSAEAGRPSVSSWWCLPTY